MSRSDGDESGGDDSDSTVSDPTEQDSDGSEDPSTVLPPTTPPVSAHRRMLASMLQQHKSAEVVQLLELHFLGKDGVELSPLNAGKALTKYANGTLRSSIRSKQIEASLAMWKPSPSLSPAMPPPPPPPPLPAVDVSDRQDPGTRVDQLVASAERRGSQAVCPHCRKSLASVSSLRRHIQQRHEPQFQHHQRNRGHWPCGSCGISLVSFISSAPASSPHHTHCYYYVWFTLLRIAVVGERLSSKSSLVRHQSRVHGMVSNIYPSPPLTQ
jgi:hypothetical protein